MSGALGSLDGRFAQDFFFELMRDSQRVRAVYLAERERWIRGLEVGGREETLFELELLLRGLDRFFHLRALFGDDRPDAERDFREELRAARDAIHRCIHLARRLMAPKREQALLFRSFVEGSAADDRARSLLGAELREQRTPEESLFLLRSGLVAYQGILDQLLRLDFAPYTLFLDVGRTLQHELFTSRYFCPPSALEFRSEYDRVNSLRLLEALRMTDDERQRRAFALALLAAFRELRSLRYVPSPPTPHTRRVLITLALVRADLAALVGFLTTDLPRLCATVEGVARAATAGRAAAVPIRDTLAQLPPILAQPLTDRSQIDEHRDKLASATKDAIGFMAQAIDPALGREALFEDEETRFDQSDRLRLDLWVFREMCKRTMAELGREGADVSAAEPLRRFAIEFRDVGYQLLRHSDRELFDRFLDLVEGWVGRKNETQEQRVKRLRDDCRRFADVLDRALEAVNQRSELARSPINFAAYQAALELRLQGG